MNIPKRILLMALIVISFNSCIHKTIPFTTPPIEGLWESTPEAAGQFAPGADQVAILMQRDTSNTLMAQGFFLKYDEFVQEWHFIAVEYDSLASRIALVDEDSDTMNCRLDAKTGILKCENEATLKFVRAGKNLVNRLLYPRFFDEDGTVHYSYLRPEQVDDGIETASINQYSRDTLSFSTLMQCVIDQDYGAIKSLLIVKDNKLIVEEYFYGHDRNDLQQIRSCTKSVTSLALGIALDRHPEVNLDQMIFDFFPQYDSLKTAGREDITLRVVLTMTSGLEWDDYPLALFKSDDPFQFILSRPLASKPGEDFNYNSGGSVLLGGVIQFLENQKPLAFAQERLFAPMGITDIRWENLHNDILRCGAGLWLRPRDMAKIGLLVLNDGSWQGKQIVSKKWVRESTRPHSVESPFFDYGHQWWLRSKSNLQWWHDPNVRSPKEHDLITALGHGGQFIMIIRDLNLVIVTTSSDFENGGVAVSKIPLAIEKIVPLFEKA